ncbi:MAG: aldo/keto reductase [Microbacteriaceae bacterium]|nr:MAG: aldo/keto reductase [Microbacteriaceae bacterium]
MAPKRPETIRLNTGRDIPQIGLGTWPLDDIEAEATVLHAAELGYRHFDTAKKYHNEAGVGRGIRRSRIPREELFITTKLHGRYQGEGRAIQGVEDSLKQLGLDYVDLVLIHWPLPQRGQFVSTWSTLETLLEDGKCRAIGTSNFAPAHLETLLRNSSAVPAVNQVQLSPQVQRADYRTYHDSHGIVTAAWSPLGRDNGMLHDERVTGIAHNHDATPAQVILRWHVQQGIIPIVRSTDPSHQAENLKVFDFELTSGDLNTLAGLAGGERAVDPDTEGY